VAFCQVRYTVQPSDTVASIARAHGISENEVLGWSEEPAIYPGQVLLIPVRSWIAGTRSAE
jgi:LysM repeat protein